MCVQVRDRELFRCYIQEYRRKGKSDLRSAGAVIVELLVKELAKSGSALRFGVNLLCCPIEEIVEQVTAIQQRLFEHEPAQYYYPPQDLNLTLVEICHSRGERYAAAMALATQSLAPRFLERERPAALDTPAIVFDRRAMAVNFLPRDERLQQLRTAIREYLARHRLAADSRYPARSAHITFLRYVRPLRTPAAQWVEVLNRCEIEFNAAWVLNPVWLRWGLTWYGMENRISRFGPMRVGGRVPA